MLPEVDYAVSASGSKTDKSNVSDYEMGAAGTPVIIKSPLTIECGAKNIYNTPGFGNFICTIDNTYVAEEHLSGSGKINCSTLKPVLFEFPACKYLKTGEIIGENACLLARIP